MNPEIVLIYIYEIFASYTSYIAAFYVGFSLLAASAALVVKAVSFKP